MRRGLGFDKAVGRPGRQRTQYNRRMSALVLQCLLKIEIPTVTDPLLIQNYQSDPLNYEGDSYEFASFQFQAYPRASLELQSSDGVIWVAYSAALKQLVDQYDGLKRAVVTATHIRLDSSRPPYVLLSQVFSSGPERGYYAFNLSNPSSALDGKIINRYFSRREFPELVFYRPG